jgi:hypothetical protein
MTDNQFEQKKQELREEMKSQGFGWIDGKYVKPPKEYELKQRELSCISMINSILAYNWFGESAEEIMQHEENPHKYKNYLGEYVVLFGRAKVVSLIQEQMDSIKSIKRNVHTDSEGLSYNSIVWNE